MFIREHATKNIELKYFLNFPLRQFDIVKTGFLVRLHFCHAIPRSTTQGQCCCTQEAALPAEQELNRSVACSVSRAIKTEMTQGCCTQGSVEILFIL